MERASRPTLTSWESTLGPVTLARPCWRRTRCWNKRSQGARLRSACFHCADVNVVVAHPAATFNSLYHDVVSEPVNLVSPGIELPKRSTRRVPCAGSCPDPIPHDVQARILDAAIRAPSGGNQQNWRFLLLDDPAKKAALAPLYQHAMGELWKSIYKDQTAAAHANPDAPESIQVLKVQRSAQWLADHFEDVPLYLFPFSQHDPTGGSIYPAVWTPCWPPVPRSGQLPDRAAPVLPPDRDVRDPRGARRPGLDPLGNRQLWLPDGHVGHRGTTSGARGLVPQRLGAGIGFDIAEPLWTGPTG